MRHQLMGVVWLAGSDLRRPPEHQLLWCCMGVRCAVQDYVFVVFGGVIGYSSDDINKFLWMVRIGGGVYPEIKEKDYLGEGGQYRIDAGGSPTMLKSLMYKLSYYE
jgi:hypothetical protein